MALIVFTGNEPSNYFLRNFKKPLPGAFPPSFWVVDIDARELCLFDLTDP